jgi:hypothetical protein
MEARSIPRELRRPRPLPLMGAAPGHRQHDDHHGNAAHKLADQPVFPGRIFKQGLIRGIANAGGAVDIEVDLRAVPS